MTDNLDLKKKLRPDMIEGDHTLASVTDKISDVTLKKRTTVSYTSYGLPEYVRVYDTNLTTVLKTLQTTYNLSSTYTSRNIIGLP